MPSEDETKDRIPRLWHCGRREVNDSEESRSAMTRMRTVLSMENCGWASRWSMSCHRLSSADASDPLSKERRPTSRATSPMTDDVTVDNMSRIAFNENMRPSVMMKNLRCRSRVLELRSSTGRPCACGMICVNTGFVLDWEGKKYNHC